MTLYLDDGSMFSVEVSPAMLRAFLCSTGLQVHDVGDDCWSIVRFDDATIENNIIPKLPKPKHAS